MSLSAMKELKEKIKSNLNASEVERVIAGDLGIKAKGKKYNCFLHKDNNPSMSFYEKGAYFKCFSCGGSYNIFDHYMQEKHLSFKNALRQIVKDFNLNVNIDCLEEIKVNRQAIVKPSKCKQANEQVYSYLSKRGIGRGVIDYVGLKTGRDGVIFEYRNEDGEHVCNKKRFFNPKNPKMKMIFETDTNINTLYNMDKINIDKPLYIVEGEIDCLSLIECGIKNVVSVPTGCNGHEWVKVCWDWLEQIEEKIIWFDNDEAGKKGAKDIQCRLTGLIKIVNNDLCNDINQMLVEHGKETVIKYSSNFQRIEDIADWEMVEDYDVYSAEKVMTGIRDLDKDILGFVFPSLAVITGVNGSGKSTIVNQMCIAESIKNGYSTFVYSGELSVAQFRYWLEHTMAGNEDIEIKINSKGNQYPTVKKESSYLMRNHLKDKMYFYEKEDVKASELLKKMEEVARREGVRVFIIDNLLTLDLECKENEEYTKQKEFVKKLKDFAKKFNSIVHLVAHPRKVSGKISKEDVGGSGSITNLAHYVLGVHRVSEKEDEEVSHDCELLMLKDRHTGTGYKEYELLYSKNRRRFYKTNYELDRDYEFGKSGDLIDVTKYEG